MRELIPKRLLACALVAALGAASAPAGAAVDKAACLDAHQDAQKLRNEGRLRDAREKLLVCAAEACPSLVKVDCERWLPEVEHDLPTVVVRVQDESGVDVTDATLTIDGKATPLDGKPIALDPGVHAFETTRGSGDSASVVKQQVLVRVGEQNRVVDVHFGAQSKKDESTSSGPSPLPWILGGVGVVALGGAAYFGLHARSRLNELRDTCAPQCDPADKPAIQRELVISDVLLGAGVVSLGVATYLFVTQKSEAPKTAFSIAPTAHGGFFSVATTF